MADVRNPTIVPVPVTDEQSLGPLRELLEASGLPHQDLQLTDTAIVRYNDCDGRMIGSGGLEFYFPYALLRSLAVIGSERGKSIGSAIVDDILERAKAGSFRCVYLLTETAHDFFTKKGFVDIRRTDVPDEVRASSEFTTVCPTTAACMVYNLAAK